MKAIRATLCLLLSIWLPWVPLAVAESSLGAEEWVRTGSTTLGAALGLGCGTALALSFSSDALDPSLSTTLFLTIPVAAMGAATGAVAGWAIADATLALRPTFLLSPFVGAGFGLLAGAFIGAFTFSLMAAIAIPTLSMPEGYWGKFDYPGAVGMAVVSGAVWGGLIGIPVGTLGVPIISVAIGF